MTPDRRDRPRRRPSTDARTTGPQRRPQLGLDPVLLEVLACPGRAPRAAAPRRARTIPDAAALTCTECGRVFPIRDGIPVLLLDDARGGPARRSRSVVTGDAPVDLHDPATLLAADAAGLLPAAALAGAQVRSVAEQLADRAAGSSGRGRWSSWAARPPTDVLLLTALLGDQVPAPGGRGRHAAGLGRRAGHRRRARRRVDDVAAAEAAAAADRRGASVLVRAAADGPVAAAAGGSLLDPAVSVPEALALPARLTLLVRSPPPPACARARSGGGRRGCSTRWRWPATRRRTSSSTPR